MKDTWLRRACLARSGLTINVKRSVQGTVTINVEHAKRRYPLAWLWYALRGHNGIEVWGMRTLPELRRCGLAKLLWQRMLDAHPARMIITTASLTPLSRPWLTRMGFTHDGQQWVWLRNNNTAYERPRTTAVELRGSHAQERADMANQ